MSAQSPSSILSALQPYPVERYSNLDLTGLVAFTIDWLVANDVSTTFENVTVAAFKLFPSKFSLVGFEEYPDGTRVNRSLLQLGPKYRNWARGSVQKGFVLTESGSAKVAEIARVLHGGETGASRTPRVGRSRTVDAEGELRRVSESALFRKWQAGQLRTGTVMDLLDMLGGYAYTPKRALRKRISELENIASQMQMEEIREFLVQVRSVFLDALKDE